MRAPPFRPLFGIVLTLGIAPFLLLGVALRGEEWSFYPQLPVLLPPSGEELRITGGGGAGFLGIGAGFSSRSEASFFLQVEGGGKEDLFSLRSRGGLWISAFSILYGGIGPYLHLEGQRVLTSRGTPYYAHLVDTGMEGFLSLKFPLLFLSFTSGVGQGWLKEKGVVPQGTFTNVLVTSFSLGLGVYYAGFSLGVSGSRSLFARWDLPFPPPGTGWGIYLGFPVPESI